MTFSSPMHVRRSDPTTADDDRDARADAGTRFGDAGPRSQSNAFT
jgi:hypothetical protein